MGLGYIHSSEYVAWSKLNGIKISISELYVLKALDRAYVNFHNGAQSPPDESKPRKGLVAQLQDLKSQEPKGGRT